MLDPVLYWSPGISVSVALAAVAVIGYVFGRRSTAASERPVPSDDIQRATAIAAQLEAIAGELRGDLAYHRSKVERFKKHLRDAAINERSDTWKRLREEAEAVLGPTLELAGQLSYAYDKIRQQSQSLAHYTNSRVDPLTGLNNGRALEEQLDVLLNARAARSHETMCSVAMLSIEGQGEVGAAHESSPLERLAKALTRQLRGSDFAARYGSDELVVVMPKTPLAGACVFGRRLRATMEVQLGFQVCCGLAEAHPGETAKALLARADAALYSARAAKPGSQYLHNGAAIRGDEAAPLPASAVARAGALDQASEATAVGGAAGSA